MSAASDMSLDRLADLITMKESKHHGVAMVVGAVVIAGAAFALGGFAVYEYKEHEKRQHMKRMMLERAKRQHSIVDPVV